MNKKNLNLIYISLVMGIFFSIPFQYASASSMTAKNVIDLINAERSAKYVQPLALNKALTQVAQDRAQDMLERGYFAHTSPQGVNPWFWFDKEGYSYVGAGENLAMNFVDADRQNEAWMKSATHQKNILNPRYQETGIAIVNGVMDGKKVSITVQEFGYKQGMVLGVNDEKKSGKSISAIGEKVSSNGLKAVGAVSIAVGNISSATKSYFGNAEVRNSFERGAIAGFGALLVMTMLALIGIFSQTHHFANRIFAHQKHFAHSVVGAGEYLHHLKNLPIDSVHSIEKMYLIHMKMKK